MDTRPMTTRMAGYGRLLLSVTLAAAAIVALTGLSAFAQEATVHIKVPSTGVAADGGPFTVSVVVEDVTNLGAFQFDLTYDPAVLAMVEIEEGPFLGSSGREVQCLTPRMERGSLGLTCVTLGAVPDGPSGSGELATITFRPLASGSSPLHFTRLTLTDPPAQPLPTQAQDATVTVASGESSAGQSDDGGPAWALWAPVIGVGVLALGAAGALAAWWARRSREP